MNPRLPASLFSLLCVAAPLLAQGEEVDLRLVPKKGTSVWLAQETKAETTMEMMGRPMESEQTITHALHLLVKDVDDKGVATVEAKVARVKGTMVSPQGEIEFDSLGAKPDEADGPMAAMSKALTAGAGKTFSVKVDDRGHVLEFVATPADPAKGEQAMNPMEQNGVKLLIESAFGMRPEKPTAVGAKWPHVARQGDSGMALEHKLELTLAKVDADAFEIAGAGTVEMATEQPAAGDKQADEDPQMAAIRQMMKNMKVKNGKASGTQRTSRQDGFVIEAKRVETKEVDMGRMTMETTTTTTMKRTSEEAAMATPGAAKAADAPKDDKKEEPKKEEPK